MRIGIIASAFVVTLLASSVEAQMLWGLAFSGRF